MTASPEPPTLLASWEGRPGSVWRERLGVATAEFHARTGSTSDRARRLVREGLHLPAIVVADRQAQGRGRRGRRWMSDTERGLWFTVAHHAGLVVPQVLPLRAGLAVAEALEAVAPSVRIQVKWPNDLAIGGRKLGGILCERVHEAVLVGIGLNLNHLPGELPAVTPPATSLRVEYGHPIHRGEVLAGAMDALGTVWTRPHEGIPASELDALNARSPLSGRPLSVSGVVRDSTRGPLTVEGLAAVGAGLLPDGSLEVRDRAGNRWRVIAGTVDTWS